MEIWRLDHPEIGPIEVQAGYDVEFRERYPDWPQEPERDDDGEPKPIREVDLDAGIGERLRARLDNPTLRMQVLRKGIPARRYKEVPKNRIPLLTRAKEGELSDGGAMVKRSDPHLVVQRNPLGEILTIDFRRGKEVVEFDPPPGSRGERYRQALESSSLKRVGYPILFGLGKGGWALAVIVLGPLLSRLLEWLWQFLPDWEFQMPSPPDVQLPVLHPPQIHLPEVHWPSISFEFPEVVEMPWWVEFLAEYSKVWVPLLIGIVLGVLALRNHRKSEERKRQWQERDGAVAGGSATGDSAVGGPAAGGSAVGHRTAEPPDG